MDKKMQQHLQRSVLIWEKKMMEIPPPSSEPPCAAWGLRMNGTSPALTATADGRHSLPRSQGKHNFVLISLVEQSSKPGIGKRKC